MWFVEGKIATKHTLAFYLPNQGWKCSKYWVFDHKASSIAGWRDFPLEVGTARE